MLFCFLNKYIFFKRPKTDGTNKISLTFLNSLINLKFCSHLISSPKWLTNMTSCSWCVTNRWACVYWCGNPPPALMGDNRGPVVKRFLPALGAFLSLGTQAGSFWHAKGLVGGDTSATERDWALSCPTSVTAAHFSSEGQAFVDPRGPASSHAESIRSPSKTQKPRIQISRAWISNRKSSF